MNKRLHSLFKVVLLLALLHTGLDMSGQTAYEKLFWKGYNPSDMESINLNGTGHTLLSLSSNVAYSLEVDVPNQKMYWYDLSTHAIMQSNLGGTNASVLLNNVIDVKGISMDFTNQVLYFTNANSTIEKINLDGTGRTVVLGSENAGEPQTLKVDATHQKLYWYDQNLYAIKRCNMDGTGVEFFINNAGNVIQLDIDEANSKLYWANWGINILESIKLDGTSRTTVASGFFNVGWPQAIAVDKINNKIYWWDADTYVIKRVNTNGTNLQVFLTDIYSVAAMIIPVARPASISSNPSAANICVGTNTAFSATATNATSYQWQVNMGSSFTAVSNGGIYSGANTATLTLTGVLSGMNGYSYRCIITGDVDSPVTSNQATLTVRNTPSITSNPSSSTICQTSSTLFVVSANSATSYQWQVDTGAGFVNLSNGGNYSNTTSNFMIVNNATLAMSGYAYRCVVSGSCSPSASSSPATLTVLANTVYYQDWDGDGYGDPYTTTVSCSGAQGGFVANNLDCDDNDQSIYPGAPEICGDGIDNNCDGNTDENCYCSLTTTWNGTFWSPFEPSADQKAVIAANYISIGDLEACSIEITENAVVTIASGHNLIVAGTVAVAPGAQLVFNSGANLLQDPLATSNSNTGSITFHKDSNSLYNLDYTIWSSPTNGTQTLKNFSPGTLDANFFVYNTPLGAYSNYLSQSGIFGGNPNAVTFTQGKGYLVRMPAGLPAGSTSVFNGIFSGIPNNGTISTTLSNQGGRFNAVGNPYPSPISIRDFIDANQSQMDNGTLYFWRKTNLASTATYVTVTNMGSAAVGQPSDSSGSFSGDPSTWIIQPGQGFLFKASITATELVFNNTMRRTSGNGQFFRNQATNDTNNQLSRLWIDISNSGNSFGQTVIGYSDTTTNGLDFGWDGRLYNDSDLSVYTKADNAKLAIQARASFTEDDAVPLSYKANNAGTLTIKMSNYDGLFTSEQGVYLIDKLFNIVHDLKAGNYTFSTEEGTFEDRFEVRYQNAALGTNDPTLDANNVIVYKEGNAINIDAGRVSMKEVNIFDIRGRLLYSNANVNATRHAINGLMSEQQVLIVQITGEHNTKTSKKIIY